MIEFKLPELGENIEQGDLVRLMVQPGASVSTGQSVMELETDKAVVEVPSSVTGTVQEIRVKEGDKIKVGQVIFTVDGAEGKPSGEPPAQTTASAPAPVQQKPIQLEEARQKTAETESSRAPSTANSALAAGARPPVASPSTRSTLSGTNEFKLPELGENISQGDLVRLMIAPGADVTAIRMRYTGVADVHVDESGALVVGTGESQIRDEAAPK